MKMGTLVFLLLVACASKQVSEKAEQPSPETFKALKWVSTMLDEECRVETLDQRETLICEDLLEIVVDQRSDSQFLDERINVINDVLGAEHFESAPFVVGDEALETLRTVFIKEGERASLHFGLTNKGRALSCWLKRDIDKYTSLCEQAMSALLADEQSKKIDADHVWVRVFERDFSLPKGCHRKEISEKETRFECFGALLTIQKHESLVRASAVLAAIEAETTGLGLEAGASVDCNIEKHDAQCVMWEISKRPPIRVLAGLVTWNQLALTLVCKDADPLSNPLCLVIRQEDKK